MSERLRYILPVTIVAALGLAACSSEQNTTTSHPASTATAEGGSTSKPECDLATSLTVKPNQAVVVQAGVAEVSNVAIARMVYGRDGKTLARLMPGERPGEWSVVGMVDTSEVKRYVRGPVNISNDPCVLPKEFGERPKDAQVVTLTGTIKVDKDVYPSFNDGDRFAESLMGAVNDGGVSVPLDNLPTDAGYHPVN